MDIDRIEIISDQIFAQTKLWHLIRSFSNNTKGNEPCEELLLEIL